MHLHGRSLVFDGHVERTGHNPRGYRYRSALREDFGGARVVYDAPLASLTTLRVGPVARRVISCHTTDQIVAALAAVDAEGGPVLVLGGGSNVVVADDHRPHRGPAGQPGNRHRPPVLRAEAGAGWDGVVARAVDADLVGWNAFRVSPDPPAPPRCRTSGPTASRWPTG